MSKLFNFYNCDLFVNVLHKSSKYTVGNVFKYSSVCSPKTKLNAVHEASGHRLLSPVSLLCRPLQKWSFEAISQHKCYIHQKFETIGLTDSDGEESLEEISRFKEQKHSPGSRKTTETWTEASDVADPESGAFDKFRISPVMISKLVAMDFPFLFPVQSNTFNSIYDGHDVVVQARTGSGKTMSYAIPIVEMMRQSLSSTRGRPPQVLVMAPTRELARQVADVFSSLSDDMSVACIYGGSPMTPQETKIRNGVDVLVGTPGRIMDFIERGTLSLKNLQCVVLDEVDRMLDMGFADSVDQILKTRYRTDDRENNPQTLLYSATIPSWVRQTAKKYLSRDLKMLDLVGKGTVRTAVTVQHLAIQSSYHGRAKLIGDLVQVYSGNHGRSIVFCQTKRDADELAVSTAIKQEKHVLHGDIPQEKREMVLKGFRAGRFKCLIATDVAARGLDIPEVDLVIQCSPPKDVDAYIHRSGRTGRAGRPGVSILIYKREEFDDLNKVQKIAGIKFSKATSPQEADIVNSATEDAIRSLGKVSSKISEKYAEVAAKLVEEQGAVPALSAALAIICGTADDKPKSLLTLSPDHTTYIFRTSNNMTSLGYAWRSLEQYIPMEVKEKITGMRLCADKQGCVFDIPSVHNNTIASLWSDSQYDSLSIADELPELMEREERYPTRENSGSFRNSRYQGRDSFSSNRPNRSFNGERSWNKSRTSGGRYSNRTLMDDMDD